MDDFEVTGLIEADEEVRVSSEVSGRVVHVGFELGDKIEKGALLVRLDDETTQAQIKRMEAMIAREQTQLEAAKKDLDRQKSLFDRGVGAEKDFDDAGSQVRMLTSQVAEGEASLEETRVMERRSSIHAPLKGRISARHVAEGEYVNPGTPLADIVKIDVVKFSFALAERDVPRVKIGENLDFTIDAYPGLEITAPVTSISPAGKEGTRTFEVKLTAANSAERPLMPGMSGKVRVIRARYEDVNLIPEDAILRDADGAYVYLVDGHAAERAAVEVVSSFGPLAVVRGNFESGSRCVILGQYALSPKAEVLVRREHEKPPVVRFD